MISFNVCLSFETLARQVNFYVMAIEKSKATDSINADDSSLRKFVHGFFQENFDLQLHCNFHKDQVWGHFLQLALITHYLRLIFSLFTVKYCGISLNDSELTFQTELKVHAPGYKWTAPNKVWMWMRWRDYSLLSVNDVWQKTCNRKSKKTNSHTVLLFLWDLRIVFSVHVIVQGVVT